MIEFRENKSEVVRIENFTGVSSVMGIIMENSCMKIHPGFVSLRETCPNIELEMSYATTQNFTGQIVNGYRAREAYLGLAPALALTKVQEKAWALGFGLKIFDAYRPRKAIAFFQEWARRPEDNSSLKELYYPKFIRMELFANGFIAERSSHSRGCAVDLTLVQRENGLELDMGTQFDFFDLASATESELINEAQRKNRRFLKDLMGGEGFRNFSMEWWHFSYSPEPFPDQSFDFDVL